MMDMLKLLIWVTVVLALYFLPCLVALQKDHKELGKIFLLNLLAGWTLLGWGVALVWAIEEEKEARVVAMPPREEPPEKQVKKRAA